MTNSSRITASQRLERIGLILKDKPEVTISELSELFAVSEMTIRRDFDKLAAKGHLKRTHGGAKLANQLFFEFDFANKRRVRRKDKLAIAHKALELIKPGFRLIIDTGTTPLELSILLKNLSDITVITPSLAVASVLNFAEGIETILLGGVIRRANPDLTGVITETNLEMFSADLAFLGADGIGLDGALYNEDIQVAHVDQKIRKRAERTYVLSDSSKIGKTALATNGRICDVVALITDNKITAAQKQALEEVGGKIIIAE